MAPLAIALLALAVLGMLIVFLYEEPERMVTDTDRIDAAFGNEHVFFALLQGQPSFMWLCCALPASGHPSSRARILTPLTDDLCVLAARGAPGAIGSAQRVKS